MLFHTWGQSWAFLCMLYAGLLAGLCFDLVARLSRPLRPGPLLAAALDLCTGLALPVLLVPFSVAANYGEPRLFLLLGAACGATLYALTFAPLLRATIRALTKCFRGLRALLRKIAIRIE